MVFDAEDIKEKDDIFAKLTILQKTKLFYE